MAGFLNNSHGDIKCIPTRFLRPLHILDSAWSHPQNDITIRTDAVILRFQYFSNLSIIINTGLYIN